MAIINVHNVLVAQLSKISLFVSQSSIGQWWLAWYGGLKKQVLFIRIIQNLGFFYLMILPPSMTLRSIQENWLAGERSKCCAVLCCAKSLQSCLTLCDPMDYSLPGSSVHGILQARILEWVAMPSCRGIFLTQGSNPHLFCLLHWQAGSFPLVLHMKH